jgi:hypothetical protein
VGGEPDEEGRDCDADRAEERGGNRHLTESPPRRREAALEKDRGQSDHADRACELGVVEVDASRPVRAEQHPEREKGHQRGHTRARGTQRDEDARGEDRADDEEERSFVHAPILPARPCPLPT